MHDHCDTCYDIHCSDQSCPIVHCSNGCYAMFHQCKGNDHYLLCSNSIVNCLNYSHGCKLTFKRSQLSYHLLHCPASVICCTFSHIRQLKSSSNIISKPQLVDIEPSQQLVSLINDGESQSIDVATAIRDSIWYDHIRELNEAKCLNPSYNSKEKILNNKDSVIRSKKYLYITIPNCVLAYKDGVICSTCKLHLRQLEENEGERLAQMSEADRKMMENFHLLNSALSSDSDIPSLVKMSSIPMLTQNGGIDMSKEVPDIPPQLSSENTFNSQIISDFSSSFSYPYRLNYFSSLIIEHKQLKNKLFKITNSSLFNDLSIRHTTPNEHQQYQKSNNLSSPASSSSKIFYCNTLCRRDEYKQHVRNIHCNIQCEMDSWLIVRCPNTQYGCTIEYERLEPYVNDLYNIEIILDEPNDAIAYKYTQKWTSPISSTISRPYYDIQNEDDTQYLVNLPIEILYQILTMLDSLSLRNLSLVSRYLREVCHQLLPQKGIVISEYKRVQRHGVYSWKEEKKHWLFSNVTSSIRKWRFKDANSSDSKQHPSLCEHLMSCKFGERKELTNERWLLPCKPPTRIEDQTIS